MNRSVSVWGVGTSAFGRFPDRRVEYRVSFTPSVYGQKLVLRVLDQRGIPQSLNDLGNLLFTFLIIWAYLAFFQFMLVWIANLPEEVIWYQPRGQSGWQGVAWALFVLHFAVPFFLLLLRDIKRNPSTLAKVAGLLLFMQLVYMYFQILPSFSGSSWQRLLPDFQADHLSVHWMVNVHS